MSENKWSVYIIESKKGKFYTGISTDVERRFSQHLSGKGGAKYFRSDPPLRIVYRECLDNRSLASKKEAAIKKMSRQQKEKLIADASHGRGE